MSQVHPQVSLHEDLARIPAARLCELVDGAVAAADRLLHLAKAGVRDQISGAGGIEAAQASAHGLAWLATYVEALRQLSGWARRLDGEGVLVLVREVAGLVCAQAGEGLGHG